LASESEPNYDKNGAKFERLKKKKKEEEEIIKDIKW